MPPEKEIVEAVCNKTQSVKLFNGSALLTSASEIALNYARFRRRKFAKELRAIIVFRTICIFRCSRVLGGSPSVAMAQDLLGFFMWLAQYPHKERN